MTLSSLLELLQGLEIQLQQPEVLANSDRLDTLLHDSFVEFGRSGRIYNKIDIIKQLSSESVSGEVWSQDFCLADISEEAVLLTYRSARVDDSGKLSFHSNRSSIWQLTSVGWQMRFHQGTATEEFVADAT